MLRDRARSLVGSVVVAGALALAGCGGAAQPSFGSARYARSAAAPPVETESMPGLAVGAASGGGDGAERGGGELARNLVLNARRREPTVVYAQQRAAGRQQPQQPQPPQGQPPAQQQQQQQQQQDPQAQQPEIQQLLVYTASLAILVDDVDAAAQAAITAATQAGGYLASLEDTVVTIRVPVRRFQEVLAAIERLGEVNSRRIQVEDVSEQYHDLEVQLANLRGVRARLQEFLARAATVPDALAVQRELERVSGQIDQIEGRLRFLAQRAAYSTITARLTRRPPEGGIQPAQYGTPQLVLPFEWLTQIGLPRLLEAR